MKVLITGGAGFIGHHVVEHFIKNTDWDIAVLDKLNYASNGFDRLRDISCFAHDRISILATDFCNPLPQGIKQELGKIDYIFHLGAETHVDNSIVDPMPFVYSNVVGTMHMLDYARSLKDLKLFVMFSTDEVFGPAPEGIFWKESDRYNCTNPYSATKAGAEQLAMAYANTYKLPIIVTNTMNVFGERQHSEKFIPNTIKKLLSGEKVIIHSDPSKTIAGSRHWVHARNVAAALLFLTNKFKAGERYNIIGDAEVDNLTIARMLAKFLNKRLEYEMVDFHSTRPGHDLRYALDGTKMKDMGWNLPVSFEKSFDNTIKWMIQKEHIKWIL